MSQISSIQRARFVPVFLGMVVLAATVALKVVGGSDAAVTANLAVSSTMHAVVRQNNDILLTFDDGSAVGTQAQVNPTIPTGTYTIRVSDDTPEHNFHLVGPGVDLMTDVGGSASPTWTVTFQAGAYRFVCDTHADFMFGLFQASGAGGGSSGGGSSGGGSTGGGSSGGGSTGGGSSSGGSTGGGSSGGGSSGGGSSGSGVSVLGTLSGTVNSTGKLKLAFNGKAVSKLKSGRYKFTVVDKTAARSFLLQQSKAKAITVSGVSFVGTKTVTLTLKAGQWTFFTSAGPKSKSAFTVS